MKNTPLAKKVAFMEKKGLTSAEIKEALRRATTAANKQEDDDEEEEPQPVRTSFYIQIDNDSNNHSFLCNYICAIKMLFYFNCNVQVSQRRTARTAVVPRHHSHGPPPPPPPPPPQGPSWRGMAVAAALAVGVGGGVTYLAKVCFNQLIYSSTNSILELLVASYFPSETKGMRRPPLLFYHYRLLFIFDYIFY